MLPGQQYLPEDILRIIWRRRWIIVSTFVVITLAAVFATTRLPNKYRSETLILVVPQRVPESYVRSTVTARIEDRLSSIQQQILSRSRLERIIESLNLYPELRKRRPMEYAVDRMRKDIEGPTIERGDAFRVGYISEDRVVAQNVTERLANLFIEENLRDRAVLAEGTNKFLEEQLETARHQLVEHDKKLEQFKREHAGELPTQVESNLAAIQRTQSQIQVLTDAISRDTEKRYSIERQIADLETGVVLPAPAPAPRSAGPDPAPGETTAQQLEAAFARQQALEMRYTPEHPDVVGAKRRVRDLQVRLEQENANRGTDESQPIQPRALANPAEIARQNRLRELRAEITTVSRQIASKQAEETKLRAVIDGYQKRVEAAPTRESQLSELMRDYTTLQNSYTSLLSKRQESRVSANLEHQQIGEQFKVLDPAHAPETPFGPDRLKLNLAASFMGLLLGVGLAGLLEYRDSSFKAEKEITRLLQVPVLALIPVMSSDREVHAANRRRWIVGVAAGLTLATGAIAAWALKVF